MLGSRDVIAEGRYVTDAVVKLAESILEEFADGSVTAATISSKGPYPCLSSPLWAPNRVSFSGGLTLWLLPDTDVDELFGHVSAKAEELGLAVRERKVQDLFMVSEEQTFVNVFASRTAAPEATVSISFGSRCFPRPPSYRGGSYEAERALIDDWSGLVGFRSGLLSESRLF
jgi:hypothetical protein